MSLWQKFGDHLGANGFDKNNLCTLLKFIDAIEDPIELPRILDNLLQIIPCLQNLVKHYSGFDLGLPLSEWRAICLELKSAPEMRAMLNATIKKGKMPLRKKYKTNPVYVAVWQRPGSPSDQHTYFQLLAHCLIAVDILRERTDKQKLNNVTKQELDDFKGNICRSLLTVRNLSTPENLIILEALPDLNIAPEALLEIIKKRSDDFDPLKVLLNYLLRIRKPTHRQEHAHTSPSEPRRKRDPRADLPALISVISSNLDPEQEEGITTFNLFQLPVVGKNEEQEIESVGCSATESCSGVEIVFPPTSDAKSKHIKSPYQKCINKRRIKTQLAMLNQRLSTRWEVPSLYEVSVCLTAIADLIEKQDRSAYLPDNSSYLELAAMLTTMFWFGQRLDKITELRVYHHDAVDMGSEPGFVKITEQTGYWWTKPAVPSRIILPDEVQKEQACRMVANFALSSGIGVEQIISDYLINIHRGRSESLFSEKTDYEEMVREFLSYVNHRHATRLTANRISDYLFDVIARQDGADLTYAMFIIGREHFLGRNPSYYTAISVTRLQTCYKEVCRKVRERHFNEKPRDVQSPIEVDLAGPWSETDQASHVGSPFRPKQRTVANLVSELKKSLEDADHSETSVLKLMRLHNSMTRYTAFLIAFSTGFRAIRDPFLSAAEIDWDTGFAVLRDKDNEDGYNSRLIWLPPVCRLQLQLFLEHQQNALYRFNILIPGIFTNPDRPRRDAPGRYMFYSKEDKDSNEYVAMTLGPKLIGTKLRSIYALPFNASRHYLRSRLLERKCPVEVINAFMGHFERGEEPWGVYSGLLPLAYRDSLMDKLVPLLKDDGWEELRGLKAKL